MKGAIVKLQGEGAERIKSAAEALGLKLFINDLSEIGAKEVQVKDQKDIESIKGLIDKGEKKIIIKTSDWRVIPFENIIAAVGGRAELYAEAKDINDARTLGGVMERGVDYVIIAPRSPDELASYLEALGLTFSSVKLVAAEVKEVRLVGMGTRVCVDTIEELTPGEGMLVGSFSSFLFLVHSEVFGSKYTSPRPFRVNAGAIHSYIMGWENKTYYLSEVKSGSKVTVASYSGAARLVTVGRAKVERRPMALIIAEAGGSMGTVFLQYAETVGLVGENGEFIAVTDLKPGNKVLVMASERIGRHFGMAVEEYMKEV